MFEYHLAPFREAIARGTAAMMPYYGMPEGLVRDGEEIEPVGFGFNRQVITGLLREELGYDGVVVTDWELVNDNHVGDQVLPARAWGVEELTPHERMERIIQAGCDQCGGEECVDVLLDLVADGRVTEARIDESVRRLLLVKFRLGLFDDPYVDEDEAERVVGRAYLRELGSARRPRRSPFSRTGSATAGPRCRCPSTVPGCACTSRACGPRRWTAGRIPRTGPTTPTSRSCGSARPSSRAPTSSSRRGSTRGRWSSRPGSCTGSGGSPTAARSWWT